MDGSIVGKFITGLVVNGNQINAKNLNVYNTSGIKTLEVTSGGDVNLNVNSLRIVGKDVATQDYTDNSVSSAIESSKEYTDTRETEIRVDMESITQSVSSVESKITKLDTQFSDNKKNIRCNDIGMKVNYSSFGITNTGYIYIHGYMNNVAYDLGGYIYTNGKSQGINKGSVDFNSLAKDMDYYLCIELGNKNLFVAYYDSGYKYKRVIGGTDSGDLDLTKSYIAIGQCRLNSSTGSFEYSYLYSTPQKLESVIGIANVETRLKSAELKITDDAITSTVTNSTEYKNDISGITGRLDAAEQKITADAIINTVSSSYYKKDETDGKYLTSSSSTITQMANQISSKVSSGDVRTLVTQNATSWGLSINGKLSGTNYNFDGTNFSIGTTSGTGKAYHSSTYSRWTHSDGSYTQAESGGLKRYVNGTGKTYHYYVQYGEGLLGDHESIRVYAPVEILQKKGVAICISQTVTPGRGMYSLSYISVSANYNISDGYVDIQAMIRWINNNTNTEIEGGLVYFTYLIVG